MQYKTNTSPWRNEYAILCTYNRAKKKLYNLLDTFDARNRLYENANGRYECYRDPEIPGDHIAEIFKGKGIRVRLRETQYNGYMFFSVSLNDLLDLGDKVELIDPQNLQAALERADEMLTGEFGHAYSIERLDLTRVDQCINLDIGSSEYVSEYIKLLNCSQMKKAAVVQLIYSEYLKTHSCRAVEFHLFEEGYRTRKGVLFDDVAVRRILTNPVYCAVDDESIAFFEDRKCEVVAAKGGSGDVGFMPYNRTNQQRELQAMDKWLVSAGAHKPLIRSADWIRVQKILEGNSAEYAKYAHRKKTDCKPIALLNGVIYCSCGAPMHPRRYNTGGSAFSYICTQKDRSRHKLCKVQNCVGKEADAAIRELILTADTDENIISRHIKKLRKSEGQVQSYRENLAKNITKSISEKQKQADNLTLSLASGNLNGAALEYVNRSLNALLKEIEELKVKLSKTAEIAAADKSDVNGISSAKEYLAAHFEEIPLLRRRELIKRIIDKVVWNGEQLEVFLVTSTSGGTEITEEVISAPEKPAVEPPKPEETDGYCEFRKCADLVVRAFAKSQNISLRQLAKNCGVSYTTIKYWTSKRNSPSHEQYEAVFKEYFLNVYKSGAGEPQS